jgi:hypothetical protein
MERGVQILEKEDEPLLVLRASFFFDLRETLRYELAPHFRNDHNNDEALQQASTQYLQEEGQQGTKKIALQLLMLEQVSYTLSNVARGSTERTPPGKELHLPEVCGVQIHLVSF